MVSAAGLLSSPEPRRRQQIPHPRARPVSDASLVLGCGCLLRSHASLGGRSVASASEKCVGDSRGSREAETYMLVCARVVWLKQVSARRCEAVRDKH